MAKRGIQVELRQSRSSVIEIRRSIRISQYFFKDADEEIASAEETFKDLMAIGDDIRQFAQPVWKRWMNFEHKVPGCLKVRRV